MKTKQALQGLGICGVLLGTSTSLLAQGVGTSTGGLGVGGSSGSGLGSALTPQIQETPTINAQPATATSNSALNSSNNLAPYYANPLFQGRAGAQPGGAPGGFGQPLFNTATGGGALGGGTGAAGRTGTGTTTRLGGATGGAGSFPSTTGFGTTGFGGAAGLGGFGRGQTGGFGGAGGFGANQTGVVVPLPRSISYTATLNFSRPAAPTMAVQQANLQTILDSSSMFSGSKSITLTMDNNVVILRGTVATEDDARLAENLLRLTPGIREIRNELNYPKP